MSRIRNRKTEVERYMCKQEDEDERAVRHHGVTHGDEIYFSDNNP